MIPYLSNATFCLNNHNQMCIEAGNILYIRNYQFEDGGEEKNKYLIVVAVNQSDFSFIRSLTTSKQYIPDNKILHGCCNNDNFSHYVFVNSRSICDNGFCFDLDTFVYYNHNVLQLSIANFKEKSYSIEVKGKLNQTEYKRFVRCIKGSRHVKRKIKNIIEKI